MAMKHKISNIKYQIVTKENIFIRSNVRNKTGKKNHAT